MRPFHYFISFVIWIISQIPMRGLYLLSDMMAPLLYRVIRYRRGVVFANLHNAFPGIGDKEIRRIARRFYRNFSDLILEVIRGRKISRNEIQSRIRFRNYEIIERLYSEKKSIIVSIGHCGNWEWMTMVLEMICPYRVFAVVKPMNDVYFESYLARIRRRFNTRGGLVPFKSTLKYMTRTRHELTIHVIAGDQTPTRDEINFWIMFLNQNTPVFLGIEKLARSFDQAVVFFDIQREGRGRYIVDIRLLTENPKDTTEGEITVKHVRALEEAIIRNPDNWLWSHRRWKHRKPYMEASETSH
ncbi:MAG: lysophospholipid acyltransferase family protein [Bacteroidales bacterium]|nr:lysophospholipid acyltransferase family protein [Bacteroidales bacterium]